MTELVVFDSETKAVTRIIRTGTGTVLRFDAGDPIVNLVEASIVGANLRREVATRSQTDREQRNKFLRRRFGAIATVLVLAAGSGTFVRNSVENSKIPTTTLSGKGHDLAAERDSLKEVKFYNLTMHGEKDLWQYTVLFSVKENMPIDEVQSIIEDANPNVNFTKIPEGGKVKVPELTFAPFAGDAGLETDQPIGDTHTT